jgi:hypothetical protein
MLGVRCDLNALSDILGICKLCVRNREEDEEEIEDVRLTTCGRKILLPDVIRAADKDLIALNI